MANDPTTNQPINLGAPSTGLRSVGAYQVSGHPFITGSADLDAGSCHMVEFDYISKSFTVINTNTENKVSQTRLMLLSITTLLLSLPATEVLLLTLDARDFIYRLTQMVIAT